MMMAPGFNQDRFKSWPILSAGLELR
jgi:hypothetical protein